jgi:hypothetical protein
MDLPEDVAVLDTFLVAVHDLVISDTDVGVAVLEEPVVVVTKPLTGLHGHPPDVEGVSRVIIGHLEV